MKNLQSKHIFSYVLIQTVTLITDSSHKQLPGIDLIKCFKNPEILCEALLLDTLLLTVIFKRTLLLKMMILLKISLTHHVIYAMF